MPVCKICDKKFDVISNTHLRLHGWSIGRYVERYGSTGVGFLTAMADIPPRDPRYKRWRESLKKRPPPWSKGFTKENHPSVAKIARTFKLKKIDNFKRWRELARRRGLIRSDWPTPEKCGGLAELIGFILGDGHIARFPRTECLTLAFNADDKKLISRYAKFVKRFFDKEPYIEWSNGRNKCARVRIYQKAISSRLDIPTGNRNKVLNTVPKWILQNRVFLIKFLRGLYEAEGSFCVHKPTSTYKLLFANRNKSLLDVVYRGVKSSGFELGSD